MTGQSARRTAAKGGARATNARKAQQQSHRGRGWTGAGQAKIMGARGMGFLIPPARLRKKPTKKEHGEQLVTNDNGKQQRQNRDRKTQAMAKAGNPTHTIN